MLLQPTLSILKSWIQTSRTNYDNFFGKQEKEIFQSISTIITEYLCTIYYFLCYFLMYS